MRLSVNAEDEVCRVRSMSLGCRAFEIGPRGAIRSLGFVETAEESTLGYSEPQGNHEASITKQKPKAD